MPWLETAPVQQRERFIHDRRLNLYTMTELCARYGVSRKTGYKWLGRFDAGGRQGLQDRSRAPLHCPHRIAERRRDSSAPRGAGTRAGDPTSFWTGSRPGIRGSTGRP